MALPNPLSFVKRFLYRPAAPISAEVRARIVQHESSGVAALSPESEETADTAAITAGEPEARRRRSRSKGRGDRPAREDGAAPAREFAPGMFGNIPVSGELRAALDDMGYLNPSPIQEGVIPLMKSGRDVVGQAQTGTGKTSAFGIPLVEKLDPLLNEVQAIALCPTRELAMQVAAEISRLATYCNLRVVCVYGGQPIAKQLEKLSPPPQIIVGTPGRVLDHMGRGTLKLDKVRVVVLDEADEMLDIGFAPDMERILRMTPKSRQTTLFSATMPTFIKRMIDRYMRNPEWVQVQPEQATVPEIQQVYYEVAQRDKLRALQALLREWGEMPRALVFCKMQTTVDRLANDLQRGGYPVEGIHGGMTQGVRTKVMAGFRSGAVKALVSTNVAARGLDIPDVTHVVSFDAPQNAEEYIHRIGRTGRMGRSGLAIMFVSELEDFDVLDQIKVQVGADALARENSAIYVAK